MKKILLILVSILLLPTQVGAMAISETFSIGDVVKVYITDSTTETAGFSVIRNSAADDPYVWMIYGGYLDFTIYDEDYMDHTVSNVFDTSVAWQKLEAATSTWVNALDVSLLRLQDLSAMGIQKVGDKYEVKGNRYFIAPDWTIAECAAFNDCNYWTMIPGSTSTKVYVVKLNKAYNGNSLNPVAYIEEVEIDMNKTDGMEEEYVLRPVVRVHKQFIDCKVGGTTKLTGPKTAAVELPTQLIGVVALAGLTYIIIRKRELFTKI